MLKCSLAIAIVGCAVAQFPFGQPDAPSGPQKGELLGEMQMIKDADDLAGVIYSPTVSMIMFTEGEEEDNASKWFYLFSIMVERSIDLAQGDARVNWFMVDNEMLRKSASPYQVRTKGIWLFCDANDNSGVTLPESVESEDAVRKAATFILGELSSAKAEIVEGVWRKLLPAAEQKVEL